MKVSDLIDLLSELDPEADIVLLDASTGSVYEAQEVYAATATTAHVVFNDTGA